MPAGGGLPHLVVTGDDVLSSIAALPPDDGALTDMRDLTGLPEIPSHPRFSGKSPRPAILADETPCAILYTSGTTGKPKGAVLSHKNLLANVRQMDDASDLGSDDNFLSVLPMFHSFGWTVCVLFALYMGSTITILDGFRPKETLRTLMEEGVTVFCGVPAMFAVLAHGTAESIPLPLKLTVAGGAPLPEAVIRAFDARFQATLVEGYGLSEASPVVCLNPLDGVRKVGSVGIPLPGVEVRVVGEGMQEVPAGEIGEIAVRGDNVMLGYYGLPAETAEALVDGWLLTGDLGRMDEDGYVYVVDRKKDLVIVSGFNVYPREIEDVLLSHPRIGEAAVIGIPDPVKGEVVKAFVVPREGEKIEKAEILDFLKPRLARYKLPQVIEFAETLPRTPSGKVLKRLLK
ncbi:MAG TPA: long-chain fatty acid--CoA ligase [Firmicutes bacterium]|nr:long-chain fatty acid--CoA ligase [Bacillota bacterium]